MKVLNLYGCCSEQKNIMTEFINNNEITCKVIKGEPDAFLICDEDAEKIEEKIEFVNFDYYIGDLSYDVVFKKENNSRQNYWNPTIEGCEEYINEINGTDDNILMDYEGGTISIVCNETKAIISTVDVKYVEKEYYYASYQFIDGSCKGLIVHANNRIQLNYAKVEEFLHNNRCDTYNEAFNYIMTNATSLCGKFNYDDIEKIDLIK